MTTTQRVGEELPRTGFSRSVAADLGLASLSGVVALLALLPFAPLDPDPHHDGVQYAAAVAVRDGLVIHRDAFSQYGPVTAWLHALALGIGDGTLLDLRVFTAVMIACSVALTFVIGRQVRLGRLVALSIAAVWLATCPAWGVFADALPLWPWPTLVALVLLQMSAALALWSLAGHHARLAKLVGSGVLLGLAAQTRLNVGVPLVLLLALAALLLQRRGYWAGRDLIGLAGGLAAGVLVVPAVMLLQGGLTDYVAQAVVGPLAPYLSGASNPEQRVLVPVDPIAIVVFAFGVGSLPVILVAAALTTLARSGRITRSRLWLAAAVMGLALTAVASAGLYGRTRTVLASLLNGAQGDRILNVQAAAPIYAAGTFTLVLAAWVAWRWIRRPEGRVVSPHVVLIGALAVGSLAQLVPRWDVYHLWWAGPFGLVLSTMALARWLPGWRLLPVIAALTVPFIIVNAYSAVGILRHPRVEITDGALAGMRVLPDRAPAVQAISDVLNGIRPGSAEFLCDDGLLAAWTGHYLADGPDYVQWSWGTAASPSLTGGRTIVACVNDVSSISELEGRLPSGAAQVAGPISVRLSPWSSTALYVFEVP